jgi:enamine deaminase RidA (YjgF/YER057c/UK114 family)/ketosteroid isomerase-like protein
MIMELERIEAGARMSQAVRAGDFIYLAGQVAANPEEDVAGQTRRILQRIDQLLEMAGSSREYLASATIYLADIADFAAMNAVWDRWVTPGTTPARATVETRLATDRYRVEIQAVAVCRPAGAAGRASAVAGKDRVVSMFADIDAARWERLSDHFTTDCIYERPGYEPLVGIDSLLGFYRDVRIIGSGAHKLTGVSATEGTGVAWGRFQGASRSGETLDERFCDVYAFRDGMICARTTYFFRPAI